jgi:PTS system nitrogen regulatory IIA component
MKIKTFLSEDCVVANLMAKTRDEVLKELTLPLARAGLGLDAADIQRALLARELMASTGIGDGVAIPHAKIKGIDKIVAAFGRSIDGIPFDSVDEKPAKYFFVLLSPENAPGPHLLALSRLAKLFKGGALSARLQEAKTSHEIYTAILAEDENN